MPLPKLSGFAVFLPRLFALRRLVSVFASLLPLSALAFGEPDPTFAVTTLARGTCFTSAARSDGSLYVPVVFYTLLANNVTGPLQLDVAKVAPNGGLDAQWGTQGLASIAGAQEYRAVPLPDGSVLHLGAEQVSRVDANGRLDAAYEQNQLADPVRVTGSYGVRADGGLVALTLQSHVDPNLGTYQAPALTAVRPDGARDLSFGVNGYVSLSNDSGGWVAWSAHDDGTVHATSMMLDASGQPHFALKRYPQDFDAASRPAGFLPSAGSASWISPTLSVDAGGRVYALLGVTSSNANPQAGLALYRFAPSGTPDASFGKDGRAFAPLGAPLVPNAISFPSDNVTALALWRTAAGAFEVVLDIYYQALGIFTPIHSLRLAKLRADGSADPSFTQAVALENNGLGVVNRLPDGRLAYAVSTLDVRDCTAKRVLGDAPAEGTMVEYYKASLDHYFMTLEGGESVLLDETPAGAGWVRTGRAFGAWTTTITEGTRRLCRFYGDLAGGPDSHFYTPEGSECDGLRALDASTANGQYAWRFEGHAGSVAMAVEGACRANLSPVFRLYNRGFEKGGVPNHRYTTDASVYADMQAKGWAGEGVAFCAPPLPNNVSTSAKS